MVLVQINPVAVKFDASAGAQDIMDRVNEITFNAPLLAGFAPSTWPACSTGGWTPRATKMLLHRGRRRSAGRILAPPARARQAPRFAAAVRAGP